MVTAHETRDAVVHARPPIASVVDPELEQVLHDVDPVLQQRLLSLDLEMDPGLLEMALEVELGLRIRAPELEVTLELVSLGPVAITPEEVFRIALDKRRAVAMISPAPSALDDDWFGRYDENDPTTHPSDVVMAERSPLQRLARWLRRANA